MNNLLQMLSNAGPFVLLVLVFAWIVCLIFYLEHQRKNKEYDEFVNDDVKKMLDEEKSKHEVKKGLHLLSFEKSLYSAFDLPENKTIVYTVRLCAVCAIVALAMVFKVLAVFFAVEVIMVLKSKVEDKKMEDENRISQTEMINKFLDFYVPSVQSGMSVRQTMQNFIAQYGDEELVSYYYSTDPNKKIPFEWSEIIQVYENGVESEEQGLQDKAELKQEEVDRMLLYFNNFKSKIAEVNPICYCYYFGIPVISIMSYKNYADIWNSWMGFVIVALLILFFVMFNRLIQKKKRDCCYQIF